MSSRIEGQMEQAVSSLMKNAQCEQCYHSKKDLFICRLCQSFCCEQCTTMHSCDSNLENNEEIPRFHPLHTQSDQPSSQSLNNNNSMGFGRLEIDHSVKKEKQISCQRCLVTTASKKCLSCKMAFYCQYCFRYIHNSSKLVNHQFCQLGKSKQIIIAKTTPQFKRPSNVKPLNLKLLGIQTKQSMIDGFLLKQINQKMQIVKTNLSIEKRQLEAQMKDSMILIKRQFDQLIDQIKMKKIEIQLKISETYKMSLQKCIQLDKKLIIQQKRSNNIQIVAANNTVSFDKRLLDCKLKKCSRQLQSIMQILDFNPIKEPLESKLSNFTDELFNIKQRISKVDIKNSFFSLDSCCNSFISLEKSQSMQSSKIESKSHKSSLNVSSIKSIEKGLISTFSITSPRKSQLNMQKIHKDPTSPILNKFKLNQSVSFNSQAQQLLREEKLNSLQFSTNIKKTALKKGIENPQEKQFLQKGLMSPKASSKKLLKSSENVSKFRPSFAGQNIQKTKHMINQIRKQMTEFTYLFKTQKQVEERCDTQRQSLDISSLSIESCKKKVSIA